MNQICPNSHKTCFGLQDSWNSQTPDFCLGPQVLGRVLVQVDLRYRSRNLKGSNPKRRERKGKEGKGREGRKQCINTLLIDCCARVANQSRWNQDRV